jgi:hypothetical protein
MLKPTQDEKFENKLVELLCQRNGWETPNPNDKHTDFMDYDIAVKDVKWFLRQFEIAGYHKGKPNGTTIEEGCCHLNSEFECELNKLTWGKCPKDCVFYDDGSP